MSLLPNAKDAAVAQAADQRSEPRFPASGKVLVETEELSIEGDLVDVSESGFRMEHSSQELKSGERVKFTHPHGSGVARVVWNRIVDGCTQTGFYIFK